MTQKQSRGARREVREQAKKQRYLMLAGVAGVLLVMVGVFAVLRGQSPGSQSGEGELSTALVVGAVAPDFRLVSNASEQVKLRDFRGRPVAVTFMHTW